MPVPGFSPAQLTEDGTPAWIAGLAAPESGYTLHAVRDLEPAQALAALGVRPDRVTGCVLPLDRPDDWTSLPRAAIGAGDATAVLLAGRAGGWTFVFDDAGVTGDIGARELPASVLAAGGGEAISTTTSINADTDLAYSVGGELLLITTEEVSAQDEVPATLRPAVEAAGTFELDYLEPGVADGAVNVRVLCAHAGFRFTLGELRRTPLLVATLS